MPLPNDDVLAERERILRILAAHESWLGQSFERVVNLINSGKDVTLEDVGGMIYHDEEE